MESILAILCIVFFAVITYGLIQGSNTNKNHLYNCRTIYIPEDIDLETAYKSVYNKNPNELKKRARQLGASREFINKFKEDDPNPDYTYLRAFIIRNSISDEHIYFEKIEDGLTKPYHGATISLELYNKNTRIDIELEDLRLQGLLEGKAMELNIAPTVSPDVLKKKIKDVLLYETEGIPHMDNPYATENIIRELRKDAGMDEY